jgi:class 3 adenylate cyclase
MDKLQIPPDLMQKLEKEKISINLQREQKRVTVLFIDMKGFSLLFKKLDTEIIFALLDLYFRVLHSIVKKNNGIVNKFFGDGLMAVWGIPGAHANDAYNAARAAIEMRMGIFHLIPELFKIDTIPLEIGISIGTGIVTSGFVGPSIARDYTLVGECILRAVQLKSIASDNRIYIDSETAQEIKPYSYLIPMLDVSQHYMLKNQAIYELEGIYELSQEFESVRRYPRVIVAKAAGIIQSTTKKRKVGLIKSIGEGGFGIEMHKYKDFDLKIGDRTIIDSRHLGLLEMDKVKGIVIRKNELQGDGIFHLKKWDIGIKLLQLPEKAKKILMKAMVGRKMMQNQ